VVTVSARAVDHEMRVTVADNGPGLHAGSEQEIFNKFTRGVRESAITGVGLGLAICKAIVEAHRGKIGATSRDGRGAAFEFTLPLSAVQPVAPGEDEARTAE